MTDQRENGDDSLDRLLREARAETPPGLAARLAAGARERDAALRVFSADVERTARRAVLVAAAAAVVAVGLGASTVLLLPPDNARVAASVVTLDVPPLDAIDEER